VFLSEKQALNIGEGAPRGGGGRCREEPNHTKEGFNKKKTNAIDKQGVQVKTFEKDKQVWGALRKKTRGSYRRNAGEEGAQTAMGNGKKKHRVS